ncbi:Hypothetical protein A7982_03550 [Minicystis rosea]|nr:Hypothetical protein A7982_03550 [Minicystis rosea]
MSDLHPLFLHGDTVFKAALTALLFGGTIAPYARRARRLAREAAAARDAMPAPVPLANVRERGGEVCVGGVLAGPKGARVLGSWGAPAREPEGGIVLRVGAEKLGIEGPVEIVVGSRESTVWGSTRKTLQLRPGDRVRVQARLSRAPEASRYRESRVGLVFEPISGVIRMAAERRPRLVAWPITFWVLGAFLGLTVWAIVFVGGGRVALDVARAATPGSDDGTRLSAAALAAATPWRDDALRVLADNLALDGPEAFERAERILEILRDCRGLTALEVRRGRADRAIQRADACGILAPGDMLFAVGRLRDASLAYREERVPLNEPAHRALRRAEAHLAARAWEPSAVAVASFAAASGDTAKDRQEALRCIGDAIRARGGDQRARASLLQTGRAMCRVLAADLAPVAERREILGNLDFVWGDNQGMDFAKLLVNRTGQALLEELGAGEGPSTDLYRYSLYPDAYLAENTPDSDWASIGVSEMGNDIAHMQRYERRHLDEHPWAIFASMLAKGRSDARDAEEVRVHVAGHVALFLAATGDDDGARAALARIADIADLPLQEPRWVRPGAGAIGAVIGALAKERPFRLKGVLHGALDETIGRAHGEHGRDAPVREALARLRAVVLDREIAVPLLLLEAFARR